ncbi:MAG: ferritin-like domain-containing protein [Myxococcales bacterium]|nr:ferritin-like domain-containing protein [Myxococcales bacterium]
MTRPTLSAKPPEDGGRVSAAIEAVYNWNYSSEVEELRTLYAKGLNLQWIAMRDLPWERGIDREAFAASFTLGGVPIQKTRFWGKLAEDTRWDVARRGAAFMLSNFLHGEQGALMVASQLVNAVPHMDGKFYAATQTLDEARHVEVFNAYIEQLDCVQPIAPSLKTLLDSTLGVENWLMKCVGMQIVVEGLALYTFRDMRETTEEPLLKELLTYVARDEARHTGFGVQYLSAVLPSLAASELAELEDFAFEATRMLLDSRQGATLNDAFLQVWRDAGIDPADVARGIADDRDQVRAAIEARGGRMGAMSGFVIPTLKRIGLFGDRIEGHFREMFEAMNIVLPNGESPLDRTAELPEDLEAWVMAGAPV